MLKTASKKLRLMTVPGVIREFGKSDECDNIELIALKTGVIKETTTDNHLLEAAMQFQLPVVSEDKKILMQAKRCGLSFYNTLRNRKL